jgi:DNA-directed RNA polymerase specialized sigma24 family protein
MTSCGTCCANLVRPRPCRRTLPIPRLSLDSATDDLETRHELPSSEASPIEAIDRAKRAHAVRQAVAALPDDMREAIVLCEWQELKVAEAADVLSTTPKSVESRLYRALSSPPRKAPELVT